MKRFVRGILMLAAVALSASAMALEASPAERASVNRTTLNRGQIAIEDWAVRLPNETNVTFRGALNTDAAGGGTGAMLYPAPNVGVLLAALVTHGLLNGASRKLEASRLQNEANKVLDPFRGIIGDLRHDDLYRLALRGKRAAGATRIAVPGEAPASEWFFGIDPVFSMTQDQRALIFDSAFVVYAPNEPAKPVFQSAVRVVSSPIPGPDPVLFWSDVEGNNLKVLSAGLLAMALDLVSAEIATGDDRRGDADTSAHRTIRYLEGASEKFERSELLRVTCGRALVKTLRGGLMSVPLKPSHAYAQSSTPMDCPL
jgi:hypothetical protein